VSQLTEEELMARFCDGDDSAFEVLFDRLGPAVQRFVSAMVRDAALAEDLTQLTFLSVIRSRDRYQRGAQVGPWVFSIAGNAARDALRRRGQRVETSAKPGDPEPAAESAPPDPGLRRVLGEALEQLPAAQREAVILHRVQGYSFEQIAAMLGTTAAAARLKAHRGYARLKELLKHLEGLS
jgi:RNA polymerase sigma-70 factor (ECF subfamily)